MRLGFFLGYLSVLSAWGGEARVEHLSKQLAEAEDVRLKMQLVVALGGISKEEAVFPLCRALRDKEPSVRQAAVKALSRLHYFSRLPCLESALKDSHANVRGEASRALQLAGNRLKGYTFIVARVESSSKKRLGDPSWLRTALQVLDFKLSSMGAHVVHERNKGKGGGIPPKMRKGSAFKKTPHDRSYKLGVRAFQGDDLLRLEMLLMTFPRQSLRASFAVRAKGQLSEKVLERMAERLLEETLEEMAWWSSAGVE